MTQLSLLTLSKDITGEMQIKASKTPYMVVGMIRALHFNRDLNQVCIQTPDEIRNKTITYLQIEFLSPGKHISTEISHKPSLPR